MSRLPRWLARIVKRDRAKPIEQQPFYGEEEVQMRIKTSGASESSNLVAGEAGTKFVSETEELR